MSDPHTHTRYHRQTLLAPIGEAGQQRLAEARVAIVGVGALGCVSADLLARAGVGTLTLIDRDVVELTNLQRQALFAEPDVGAPKAEAARRRLADINSEVRTDAIIADLTPASAERLLGLTDGPERRPSLILDGTDNFLTRMVVNDAAVKHNVPWIYAGVIGTRAMVAPIPPGGGPCLRCLLGAPPAPGSIETCDTAGVLGAAASVAASIQAAEAIKILVGDDASASRELLEIDLWSNQRRAIALDGARLTDCPCCGLARYDDLDQNARGGAAVLCGRDAIQISPPETGTAGPIDLDALARRLAPHGEFTASPYLVQGALHDAAGRAAISEEGGAPASQEGGTGRRIELTVFRDGRAIIRGAGDPATARSIYDRFIGG